MSEKNDKFVRIIGLNGEIQAQLIEAVLLDVEIPFRIRRYKDSVYNGLFEMQFGWGDLFAPAELAERIISVLSAEDLLEDSQAKQE